MSKVSAPVHLSESNQIYASATDNVCGNKHIFSIIFDFNTFHSKGGVPPYMEFT